MKTVTKMSLEQLAQELPKVSYAELDSLYGGLDAEHDCFWRCMAYLAYGADGTTPEVAMAIANECLGDDFDENNYAFSGNATTAREITKDYFDSLNVDVSGTIAVFNSYFLMRERNWTGNILS